MATASKSKILTSEKSKIKLRFEQIFDSKKKRHYFDGRTFVLHCHHYASLLTQLALDAEHLGGTKLLCDAAEESFKPILEDYFKKHKISEKSDRVSIAEQYFRFSGLGQIEFSFGVNNGYVILKSSHIDQGWIKKWGENDKPVNFIGMGFIQAVWGAVFEKNSAQIDITETQSMVCGAPASMFTLSWEEGAGDGNK